VDIRQVRSFLKVAGLGSIAAAAERTHLSASALSRQIKALEEHLGIKLLQRSAHSIQLTTAGEMFVRDATTWVEMADRIAARVREIAQGDWIRVAYAPSLAGAILGHALECFAQIHPNVCVRLFDASTAEMKQGLQKGLYDLIVTVPEPADEPLIEWRSLSQLDWQLAMSADDSATGPVSLDELTGRHLLIYDREEYPDYWNRIRAIFRQVGVAPVVVGEFDGWTSLKTAVEGGLGVALVTGQHDPGPRLTLRSIDPAPEPVHVAVGWKKGSPLRAACAILVEELSAAANGSTSAEKRPRSEKTG
jgi:DNA-binding transcriptional LysR family regulator